MFLQKSTEESSSISESTPIQQKIFNLSRQKAKEEKNAKFSNLRQLYTIQQLNWHKPVEAFILDLQKVSNQYSILITLFEIAQQPLWRNKVPHLCSLIKALHNKCIQRRGSYLSEITSIPNYHQRLCRVFYLNNNLLQEHFKLLMMIYLSYNRKEAVLDQNQIALGLMQAGRNRTDNRLPEYLWIVSQLKVDSRGILKLLKYGTDVINQTKQQNLEVAIQTLIPIITSISNYVCSENDLSLLLNLMDNELFQRILMHCLSQSINSDLSKQTILLCNNFLVKSPQLAKKIISCQQVLNSIEKAEDQEAQIWKRNMKIYSQETGQNLNVY